MFTVAQQPAWRALLAATCLSCAFTVPPASAQAPAQEPVVLTLTEAADLLRVNADQVERLAEGRQIPARRIGTEWRFNRTSLLEWLNGDSEPLTKHELRQVTGSGAALLQTAPKQPGAQQDAGTQDKPVGEAPEGRTAEEVLLRGRRVLLGRGEVVVDFGQFYARTNDVELAVVQDRLGLATVERSGLISLLLGRVGVFNETELFASTTFQHLGSHLILGNSTLASSTESQVGDVTIGLNRTLLREGSGRPDIIGNVAVRIPTHDTPYSAAAGVALVKSIDPVVLFASANYVYGFERRSTDVLQLDPQGLLSGSVGYGLALNDTIAISTSFSGLFTGNRTLSGSTQRQTDFFSARFALTSRLAERLYIEPSVSFGIGGPQDRLAFGITIPYTF